MFKSRLSYLFLICLATYQTAYSNNELIVQKEYKHDVSLPLRLIDNKSSLGNTNQIRQKLAETGLVKNAFVPVSGFQGLGEGLGDYHPMDAKPDPAASVGMMQYVQWAGSHIAVFDKSNGKLAPGFPKPGTAVWSGFGGPCENQSRGLTTVKYDQLAKRWVLTHHAYADILNGPFYQCLAVSTSEDATASYYRYAFPLNGRADYARFGLWRDAYYMGFNLLTSVNPGPVACAFDRNKILQGQSATMQCRRLTNVVTSEIIPADLDGIQLPQINTPEFFIGVLQPSSLFIIQYHVDFTNPNNSTIKMNTLAVNSFLKACSNVNGNSCAIQPQTTTRLNVMSDRLMHRAAYRQFRDYGSLVVNHTVEGPAPKFSPAIRWYELRLNNNAPDFLPSIFQQSTFAPDSKNRFLGSIAIDRFTNIAVGYNVTSSLIYPSLEVGIHNFADQHNVMKAQALFTGKGSQTNDSNWGSFSTMNVDPIDECTFWYGGEYLKTTGNLNWSTYILKFKLAACV